MRRLIDIKKAIGHAKIVSKPQADRAILEDLLTEFKTGRAAASGPAGARAWRTAVGSRGVRVAAAAAVVILSLFLVGRGPHQPAPSPLESGAESAADLLSVGYLNAAYRRGGLEAVNRQCEDAVRRQDNWSERISLKELILQLQGNQQTKG